MNNLKIYYRYIINDIKSQLSYPKDFIIQLIVWLFYSVLPFIALSILFSKFKTLGPWNLYSMGIFYSIVGFSYDLSRMVGRSFDNFHQLLKTGNFDMLVIRPCSLIIQILGDGFFLRRIAGLIQYSFVFAYSYINLTPTNPFIAIQSLFSVAGTFLIFLGLLIIYAGICFKTIDKNLFSDLIIDTSAYIGYYPLDVIIKPLKIIFSAFIPIGLTVYLPLKPLLLDQSASITNSVIGLILPIVIGTIFFLASKTFFYRMRKKYVSINS